MSSRAADRQLLFGILALQNDFIDRDQLLAALRVWVEDKSRPLEDVLREQGALSEKVGDLLEPLVALHIERHGGDAEQSLAALSSVPPIRDELGKLGDAEIEATMTVVPSAEGPSATASVTVRPAGDRFRIVRPHAEGGLGRVSVAIDGELDREVAFKEIKESHADDQLSRDRFTFEAEVTGSLEHPGIVPVYGLGHHDDGRPFYAMRFVRGHSLQDAIRDFHAADSKGKWKPDEREGEFRKLLGRFCDVCDAIEYAHSRGVLHRDLKPGNVMLGKYGETLVVDWGLAKIIGREQPTDSVDGDATLQPRSGSSMAPTLAGTTIGSPAYMSPEQAEGRLDDLGPASDVYSLGATLYSLLTNTAPHLPTEGDSDLPSILAVAREGRIDRPRDRKPDVPLPLEAVCLKAMSLKPSARYTTCAALAEDVQAWLADRCPRAYAEPLTTKAARVARRHRGLVAAGLVATILLAVSIVSLAYQSRLGIAHDEAVALAAEKQRLADSEHELREEAVEQRGLAEKANRQLQTLQDDLAKISYADAMSFAYRLLNANGNGDAARARRLISRQHDRRWRGWEWAHLKLSLASTLRRPMSTLEGHSRTVNDVSFSPDGTLLVSASDDLTVRLWDAGTGRLIATLEGHTGEMRDVLFNTNSAVRAVSFNPDGTQIASAGTDGTVRLWDGTTGRPIAALLGHTGTVTAVAFSNDGTRLISGSWDNTARLWDAPTGRPIATLEGHTGSVNDVAFSHDGMRVMSASADNTLRLWEAATGRPIATLEGHASAVSVAAFSPDGTRIVSGSWDNTARLWDAATGRPVATLGGHSESVRAVSFSPDGTRVATGADAVRLWDTVTGRLIALLEGHTDRVDALSFSSDGTLIASTGLDSTVRLWNAVTGVPIATLEGHTRFVSDVSFSPDGTRVASAGLDETIRVWDTNNYSSRLSVEGHSAGVEALAFSPDGMRVVSSSRDKTLRVWDAETGRPLQTLEGHTERVDAVSFSPDGAQIVSAGFDNQVRLWDAETGRAIKKFEGHTERPVAVSFSSDGTRIASAGFDNTVRLWDPAGGRSIATLEGHTEAVSSVSFSPDGSRIASASWDHTVRLWHAVDGRPIATLEGHTGWVVDVSFSPDGTRIASASHDDTVRLWDAETGRTIATLVGHTEGVHAVSFNADGTRIASSGEAVRLWDGMTGHLIATLEAHTGVVDDVVFSPDGKRIVSAGRDKTVRVWDATTGQLVATLKGHTDAVTTVAFSSDGKRIASAGRFDKAVSLWLTENSRETCRMNTLRLRSQLARAALEDERWFAARFHIRSLFNMPAQPGHGGDGEAGRDQIDRLLDEVEAHPILRHLPIRPRPGLME